MRSSEVERKDMQQSRDLRGDDTIKEIGRQDQSILCAVPRHITPAISLWEGQGEGLCQRHPQIPSQETGLTPHSLELMGDEGHYPRRRPNTLRPSQLSAAKLSHPHSRPIPAQAGCNVSVGR